MFGWLVSERPRQLLGYIADGNYKKDKQRVGVNEIEENWGKSGWGVTEGKGEESV